jgi:hypothetical protein
MQQPDGFDSTWVACLLKGLYGLKQDGREWFRRLEEVLVELGFVRIRSDSSVFIWEKDGLKVIVPVFVDNITLASKSKEKIAEIKGLLAQRFKMRDLGPTLFLLGVPSTSTRSTFWSASASQTAAPSPRRSTPACASTCPSALRRLRTTSSCATSRT